MSSKKYERADGEYGDAGESFVRSYIRSNGYQAVKHPNGIYGKDIEYLSARERFYVDVERATESRWSGDSWFRFPTIHVLARREVDEKTLFFTVSADMTKAYVSFPCDLLRVHPKGVDNKHAINEPMRDHEIIRCLPIDLTRPIDGSIAEMNAKRVRAIVRDGNSYEVAVRALRGRKGGPGYECPYGIDEEEYRELLLELENRSGLAKFVSRELVSSSQRMLFQ